MKFLTHIDLNRNQLQFATLHPLGAEPAIASSVIGQVYYNTAEGNKKLYVFDGSSWTPVGDITSVASTTSQLAVTSGTVGAVSLALDIATTVTNGGTGLVTSDLLFDYIAGGTAAITSVVAGTGISVSTVAGAATVSHADTSSVSNLVVSGRTYVTGLTFDTFGHVTGVSTGTETVVDTNTTYTISVTDGPTNDANINLIAGGSGTGTVSANIVGTDDQILIGVTSGSLKIGFTQDVIMPRHLTVSGNLTVSGTVTTVNTETINLADNIITLNSNYIGSTPTENGGIEVERGTIANVSLVWNESTDRWTFTNDGSTFYNIPISGDATITSLALTQGNAITIGDTSIGTAKAFTISANATSETASGVIELATQAEVNTGTDAVRAVTPATLATYIAAQTAADSFATTLTATAGAQVVAHGLGTADLIVQLFDTLTGETIYADIARAITTPFAVTVTFITAPVNTVRALVQKID